MIILRFCSFLFKRCKIFHKKGFITFSNNLLDSFCSRIVNIFFCDTFSIAINLKSFCYRFICCCTCKTIALFIFKLLPLTHKKGLEQQEINYKVSLHLMSRVQEVKFQEIETGDWKYFWSGHQIILPVFRRSKVKIKIWSPDHGSFLVIKSWK
jgi:hypothetical protein